VTDANSVTKEYKARYNEISGKIDMVTIELK
jgi:hypothetical protein